MPSDRGGSPPPGQHQLPDVPGYELTEVVTGTATDVTFRGHAAAGGAPVLIEMYRTKWPTERELAARRHAYEIGASLEGVEGIIEHIDLVETEADLALVTADPGTEPLATWLTGRSAVDLLSAVRIGRGLAGSVGAVHGRGIVHNLVAPAWFHIDPVVGSAAVTGFARSTRLRSEAAEASAPGGTLAYMSPEQTGRMNRPVDARSDLYALGVILFELLTGRLPFDEPDPLAMVHAHIARPAPAVNDVDPSIPALISDIVATLLNKNAEDRYATARGLTNDLGRAAALIEAEESLDFELRQADIGEDLVLPQGLYGRDRELATLQAAFTDTANGQRRALFVAGYSGIGKSQLINEVQPSIVERSGWFGGGKFDLFRRDIPYLGLTGAIEDIVRQALTLPEQRLSGLRDELQARLGANAAALTEVVPELRVLLGDPPPLSAATPAEAQARFNQAFRNLVRTLAGADSPLVLFVDDLQWTDLASLRLLEAVLEDREASHLLILGAWRDNEVGPDHPLLATLRRLNDVGMPSQILELGPLAGTAIDDYLADTVHQPTDIVKDISALVQDKTGGNPFFMRQFLEELNRDDLLAFDQDSAAWSWDVQVAQTRQITDNVADLMAHRLATLPAGVGQVVGLASCIGSTFDLRTVAGIAGINGVETARALNQALVEGLIVPLDDSYRYAAAEAAIAAESGTRSTVETRYAFAHDRVHEAAHDALDTAERAGVHLSLARSMMAEPAAEDDERSVVIASHLSEAMDLLTDSDERLRAAGVFLRAGSRAKATMATAVAAGFLENGLALLSDDAWDRTYDLALALHTGAADAAYIEQRFDDVDRYAPQVLANARTNLDRVPIHTIKIGVGVARRAYREATVYAVDVLADEFGIVLPRDPTTAHVMKGVAQVKLALRRHTTADLLALPPMEDPATRAVMDILMKTATNAYWATPNLVPLIAFEMCRLSVEHGNIGLSAYGYALYGMIASAALGQLDVGYAYGKLAMDLLETTGDSHLIGKTALLWHGFIRHNKDPIRECGPDILEAYDTALDAGDVENAVYCGTVAFFTDLLAGRPIGWLRQRYGGYIEAMLDSGQDQTIGALRAWLQCVDNLADPERVEPRLVGDYVDMSVRLPALIEAENGTAIPVEVSAAGFLAFMLGDMAAAEEYLGLGWERREGAPGQSFKTTCFALYAVTLVRKRAGGSASAQDRARLTRIRRALGWRATHNPHDVEPLVAFLEAEVLKAGGDAAAAQRYLDTAAVARERGFAYLEGLALEQAAELHGARGHTEMAGHLLSNARRVWRRYGAMAKVKMLGGQDVSDHDAGQPGADDLAGIDTRTLLDSVHAISSEIEHDRLVQRVMTLAVQNAGATGGVLVLSVEDALETAAKASVGGTGEIVVEAIAPDERPYPKTVVDFTIRTGEALLLDDASTEEPFSHDPYVAANKTRSVLGVPLLRSGELVGVLYLENALGVGAFTERHLDMLAALGGQAAVSLENSRLFERQRAQAEAFAHFVPRPFLEQLNRRSIVEVELGDAVMADLAVLFSDLRSFTTLSEGLSADDSFALLNEYLAYMEPPIRDHGGFIDKFIGDAVMALFVGRAEGAVAAAVGMHRALRTFNAAGGADELRMGIGIHAGPAMLGTVGSPERMETTVIGDTVNTASRLEGMTKPYHAPVLISSEVVDRLSQPIAFTVREVGRVRVKGKEQATTVHEVLDARPAEELAAFRDAREGFDAALAAWYEGDFAQAGELFEHVHRAVPTDVLAADYVQACAVHLADGVTDWDGVDVRTDK